VSLSRVSTWWMEESSCEYRAVFGSRGPNLASSALLGSDCDCVLYVLCLCDGKGDIVESKDRSLSAHGVTCIRSTRYTHTGGSNDRR
jgi:hypothetical protein